MIPLSSKARVKIQSRSVWGGEWAALLWTGVKSPQIRPASVSIPRPPSEDGTGRTNNRSVRGFRRTMVFRQQKSKHAQTRPLTTVLWSKAREKLFCSNDDFNSRRLHHLEYCAETSAVWCTAVVQLVSVDVPRELARVPNGWIWDAANLQAGTDSTPAPT